MDQARYAASISLFFAPHFFTLPQVVRPSRLSLGRVSVVRGYDFNSRPVGCVMVDDYIKTPEQVVDYSTRYSGLVSGDLDPAISKHHLIPLKRAYLKIRFMVDSGWTFVGHHLQKDFRILNIYVPPERIIDTVQVCNIRPSSPCQRIRLTPLTALPPAQISPHAVASLSRLPCARPSHAGRHARLE